MGGRLHRGGDLAVEEDDAVPRLLGRGHSSTALVHGKGQVRTLSNTLPKAIIRMGLHIPQHLYVAVTAVQYENIDASQ